MLFKLKPRVMKRALEYQNIVMIADAGGIPVVERAGTFRLKVVLPLFEEISRKYRGPHGCNGCDDLRCSTSVRSPDIGIDGGFSLVCAATVTSDMFFYSFIHF